MIDLSRTLLCACLGFSGIVSAQTAPAPATDEPPAICTDRPTKATAACVVDAGHLQVETDVVNYTHFRIDGTTTETWLATNPTLKYGMVKDVDIEANISPYEVVRTRGGDSTATLRGPGDLFVRGKWNFYSDDHWTVTAAPYVKAPTARHGIGNGAIEAGLVIPVVYQLTDKIALTTSPEFDSLKDADNTKHHFNTVQVVNVGVALPHDLTAYAELWGDWNVDPQKTVRQYSADVALAWAASKVLQFDGGLNFGLNRNTPSIQAYIGVSRKF